jgi:hypothetical protein
MRPPLGITTKSDFVFTQPGAISAANFFERGGGSCFNTGRQGTKMLIFTVAYLRLINW